jgi:hypothetical protein
VASDDARIRAIERDLTERQGLDLAAYQPGFLVDQIVAAARFKGLAPELDDALVKLALDNLTVGRTGAHARGGDGGTLARVA